jgi:hypothetical protein
MPTALIHGMSPLTMGATVFAADEITPDPGVNLDLFRHSGNAYGSQALRLGIAPSVRFRTPFLPVFNALGFRTTKLTAFSFTFRKFTDYLTASGSVHPTFSLAASATAAARIVGASVSQRGLLMADVDVTPLSADGLVSPLSQANAALPTLAAEPALHTLGPVVVNGTKINGVANAGFDLGINLVGDPNDGETYTRTVHETDADPTLNFEHNDPVTLLTSLGLAGVEASSNIDFYFRDITNGMAAATGLRLRCALGTLIPGAFQMRRGAVLSQGASMKPLSVSTTHPIVVATGQTIPVG